jgi:hypothetical protein
VVYRIYCGILCLVATCAGGCGLTKAVIAPKASVDTVSVVSETDEGARLKMVVILENANAVALPLKRVDYRLVVEGVGSFTFRDDPNRILPGARQVKQGETAKQELHLFAGIETDGATIRGKPYKASGTVTYEPPGEIRKLLTDSYVPLPITSFFGSGTLRRKQ